MKIYDIDKQGNICLVQMSKYGPYLSKTEKELEELKETIRREKHERQKELDRNRDNGWSDSELADFYRKGKEILKTELLCEYCTALESCKHFKQLMMIVTIQNKLRGEEELFEDYSRRWQIMWNKMIGCCKARLRRHCKRRFSLFNHYQKTEIHVPNFQPRLSDYLA